MPDLFLEFTITRDDLVAFNRYHAQSSPTWKRVNAWYRFGCGCVVFASLTLLSVAMNTIIFALAGLLTALIYVFVYPLWVRRWLDWSARRFYGEGANRGTLGWHRLTLQDDASHEESETGTQTTSYAGIERVAETDEYLFVYIGAVQAHVIPKTRLQVGDAREFAGVLRGRLQKSAV